MKITPEVVNGHSRSRRVLEKVPNSPNIQIFWWRSLTCWWLGAKYSKRVLQWASPDAYILQDVIGADKGQPKYPMTTAGAGSQNSWSHRKRAFNYRSRWVLSHHWRLITVYTRLNHTISVTRSIAVAIKRNDYYSQNNRDRSQSQSQRNPHCGYNAEL